MDNHSYEEQTLRLLADTKTELEALEASRKELDEKIVTLTREAHAYELALQGYRRRTGKVHPNEPDWDKILQGLTHKQRLMAIAGISGGKIRVSHAADLLYSRGFIKSKKRGNAYTMVQNLLADMIDDGKFERVEAGEYRLVGAQQALPNIDIN